MGFSRRIQVLDLLILVAFTAVGLGWFKAFYDDFLAATAPPPGTARWGVGVWRDPLIVHMACRLVTCLLVAWSLAFVIMRLRNPRPPLRQALCGVGTSAAFTAGTIVVCRCLEWALTLAAIWFGPRVQLEVHPGFIISGLRDALKYSMPELGGMVGPGVAVAWTVLALTGRLRLKGCGWLEAFGALLGVGWLLLELESVFGSLRYLFGDLDYLF
jgi:hypothetical protein